jgi:hypothetical protein
MHAMMKIATWLSVIILGPGAVAIFIWFLLDLKRILRPVQHVDKEET